MSGTTQWDAASGTLGRYATAVLETRLIGRVVRERLGKCASDVNLLQGGGGDDVPWVGESRWGGGQGWYCVLVQGAPPRVVALVEDEVFI